MAGGGGIGSPDQSVHAGDRNCPVCGDVAATIGKGTFEIGAATGRPTVKRNKDLIPRSLAKAIAQGEVDLTP